MTESLTDSDVLKIFVESGALLTGHFVLTSGKHSDRYFEKFDVLNQPAHVETLCQELAKRLAETKPEVILGPTTLGILLAFAVAKGLGVTAAYGERGADGKKKLPLATVWTNGFTPALDLISLKGTKEKQSLKGTAGSSLLALYRDARICKGCKLPCIFTFGVTNAISKGYC